MFEVEKSISLEQSVEMKVTNIQSDKYKNWLAEGNTPLEQDNVKQMVDQYKVDLPVYMRNSVIKSVLAEFEKGTVEVNIDRVFEFAEVVEAHQYMESNQAKGKLVVRIE